MHISSALRRRRDEIVATIAVYEARIEAARTDLAALNQVARAFRSGSRTRRDPTGIREVGELEDAPSAECEVWESERPLAMGQLALPETHVARGQIPEEFFYLNRP
jgi:hypothetical protein